MTTTSKFQILPTYFSSPEERDRVQKSKKPQTNPRYKYFNQIHFTAGDASQFEEYRNRIELKEIEPFKSSEFFSKFGNLNEFSVENTFSYIFHKFKKGIFVQIKDNKISAFLPFSKKNFINEWSHLVKINPAYKDAQEFANHINMISGKSHFKVVVNKHPETWFANNSLIRYEFPVNEGDTNVSNIYDMLEALCKNRKIPDIEFFVNRRDFPLLTKDETEPYDDIFGDNVPLLSHNYNTYAPILSMVSKTTHADIAIPTGEDWSRVCSKDSKFFIDDHQTFSDEQFDTPWEMKKDIAVFRGSSTGNGVCEKTNSRLKLAKMSNDYPDYLDAGITKFQVRARKLKNSPYLQTFDLNYLESHGIKLASFLSPKEQSMYKYIINIDGHVSAFRLSLELSMGSCLMLVDSEYSLWYKHLLKPMQEYIPIKSDLSDLVEKIKWCRLNDDSCKKIAQNAKKFFETYLQKDGILDYLQKLLTSLRKHVGNYTYTESEIAKTINIEKDFNIVKTHGIYKINKICSKIRNFGLLKGMENVFDIIDEQTFQKFSSKQEETIFKNKHGTIKKIFFAGLFFVVKQTTDNSKLLENLHEVYISKKALNSLVFKIPNFAYVFQYYDNMTIIEYIRGQTLDNWMKKEFSFKDYIHILVQITLSLHVAQKTCEFVHYDLAPWNIVLQDCPNMFFDYKIDDSFSYRVYTEKIPIFIDFGKSLCTIEKRKHGFVSSRFSTIQDILYLLLTSISEIDISRVSSEDTRDIIKLANFISQTEYCPKEFNDIQSVLSFFRVHKKYENASVHKKNLEEKTCLDFLNYLTNNFNVKFEKVDISESKLSNGNPEIIKESVLVEL